MTRKLYWAASTVFWLAVAGFWIGSLWVPETQQSTATAASAERRIALKELTLHAKPNDCWMAIRGTVYDFSAYIPQHPTSPEVITAWCGKEATEAYNTKMRGRPHSPYANELLAKYWIGALDTSAH